MKRYYYAMGLAALVLTFSACRKNDNDAPVEKENKFVRILVSDDASSSLTLLNPATGTQTPFTGSGPLLALYPTGSGRFAGVVNSSGNLVSFFDSGVEAHDDHAHLKGTPKWALTTSTRLKPAHFKAWGNQILAFNDGDGTLSAVKESDLHTQAATTTINAGTAHHGAMAIFNNGSIAVTVKTGTVAGSLPEKIKVIDASGNTLHTGNISTAGMHGNAGNGTLAAFGAPEGILTITDAGVEKLIPYPNGIGSNWLSTLHYGKASAKFIGVRAKFGVFLIDPTSNTISALYQSDKIKSASFDAAGRNVIILEENGTIRLFNPVSKTQIASANMTQLVFPATGGPAYTSSTKYVYLTNPEKGEVYMLRTTDLTLFKTVNISGKPGKIAMIGADLDKEDND